MRFCDLMYLNPIEQYPQLDWPGQQAQLGYSCRCTAFSMAVTI